MFIFTIEKLLKRVNVVNQYEELTPCPTNLASPWWL